MRLGEEEEMLVISLGDGVSLETESVAVSSLSGSW